MKMIQISVNPSNCNIDMTMVKVYLKTTTQKIQINPCTSNCVNGQFMNTSTFIQTKLYI
jgi:hypothetical protein